MLEKCKCNKLYFLIDYINGYAARKPAIVYNFPSLLHKNNIIFKEKDKKTVKQFLGIVCRGKLTNLAFPLTKGSFVEDGTYV